jgi:hypothetical protein
MPREDPMRRVRHRHDSLNPMLFHPKQSSEASQAHSHPASFVVRKLSKRWGSVPMSSRYHRRSVSGFNIVVRMLRPSDPAIDCIALMAELKIPLSWTPRCANVQWSDRATLRCLSTTIRLLQDYCFSTRRRSVARCGGAASRIANPRAQFPCGTPSPSQRF